MLNLLFTDPYVFIIVLGGLILAIGIHEAAHCYMADYLGDPTPRAMGRLTLNPLAHLDPIGTLMIVFTGMFGWGKASPFDPYNLRHPQRDTALIALAGPISNIVLAILLSLVLRFFNLNYLLSAILISLITLNINLAIFNLLPIPPLDGSKIFSRLAFLNSQAGYLILLLLIFTGVVGKLISPITNFLISLLLF